MYYYVVLYREISKYYIFGQDNNYNISIPKNRQFLDFDKGKFIPKEYIRREDINYLNKSRRDAIRKFKVLHLKQKLVKIS
jgi:hypothetical protein